MVVAISFATANNVFLKKFNNKTIDNIGDAFFFNGSLNVVWIVIMAIWFFIDNGNFISVEAIIFGLVYGLILCAFFYFKMQSLAEGPVSFTTLISSAAFVPATIFGIFYASESASWMQILGMVVMLISLYMCVNPKKSAEKLTTKWFVYCILFFTAGSLLGMFYKVFGKSGASSEVNGMMLSASIFASVFFFLMGVILNKSRKLPMPKIKKPSLIYILLSGITGCFYIRINLALSSVIPSAIFFPVSNGSLVILSTVIGCILFKEKLNKIQWLGILVGIVAIVLSGVGNLI